MPNFLFTDESTANEEESFELSHVLKTALNAAKLGIHTGIPAKVTKYYKDDGTVDCIPVLKQKFPDGETVEMAKIQKVPVAFPQTKRSIIAMPVQKDDYVWLMFSERSIDAWIQNGGIVDPADKRTHHLADAVAYVGIMPNADRHKINNDNDIIIKNTRDGKKTEVRIKQNGKIQCINQTDELFKLLYRFVKAIASGEAVAYTSTGAQPLRHFEFSQILSKLETFIEKSD